METFSKEENLNKALREHLNDVEDKFNRDNIFGIFLRGSQNYGLDLPTSDVDSLLVVVPTFRDLAFGHKPVSTTFVRENEEHTDLKDVRLLFSSFLKQSPTSLEVLFTDYKNVSSNFSDEYEDLLKLRERIARFNPWRAVWSFKGYARKEYDDLWKNHPSRAEVFKKNGYDPKCLSHLLRAESMLKAYVDGADYKAVLKISNAAELKVVKEGIFTLSEAREKAESCLMRVEDLSRDYLTKNKPVENVETKELLMEIQYRLMSKATRKELE